MTDNTTEVSLPGSPHVTAIVVSTSSCIARLGGREIKSLSLYMVCFTDDSGSR